MAKQEPWLCNAPNGCWKQIALCARKPDISGRCYTARVMDFTLTTSREPQTHQGRVVSLQWSYTNCEIGDLVKYSPAGMLTIFRQGDLVAQQQVTALAMRSFKRAGWLPAGVTT